MNSAALKRALKKELPGASTLPTARASNPSKPAPTAISIEASSVWEYSHAEHDASLKPAVTAKAADNASKEIGRNLSSSAHVPEAPQEKSAAGQKDQAKAGPASIPATPGADVLKLDDDEEALGTLEGNAAGRSAKAAAQHAKPTADELLVRLKQEQSKQQQDVRPSEAAVQKPEGIADFLLLEDAASGMHSMASIVMQHLQCAFGPAPYTSRSCASPEPKCMLAALLLESDC